MSCRSPCEHQRAPVVFSAEGPVSEDVVITP
jgi:hypothetical protein